MTRAPGERHGNRSSGRQGRSGAGSFIGSASPAVFHEATTIRDSGTRSDGTRAPGIRHPGHRHSHSGYENSVQGDDRSMIRSLAFAALCCAVFTIPSSVATAGSEGKRTAKKAASTTVQTEGASLEFQKLNLPRDASDDSVALEKLRELKGVLKLQKDVAYRRSTLPAGSYPVSIVLDDSQRYYFVIGNPPRDETKKPRTGKSEQASGMGVAGQHLLQLGEEPKEGKTKKTKQPKKSKQTKTKTTKSTKTKGRSAAKKKSSGKGTKKEGEAAEKKDGENAEPKPWLRARMYFVELKEATGEAYLDLKAIERGKRLELSACSGTSCGRVRLTFVTGS